MHLSLFSLFATKLSAAGLIVFGGNPKLLNGQRAEITAKCLAVIRCFLLFQLNRKSMHQKCSVSLHAVKNTTLELILSIS